jgi:hypothetical protein
MTIEQAEKIGRIETLKWTFYTFLAVELYFMFKETSGDFANGILFFIERHKHPFYLPMVSLLFIVTYFIGTRNGKDILLFDKHFFLAPFKHGLFTVWIVLAFACLGGLFWETDRQGYGIQERLLKFFLEPFVRSTIILLIPLAFYAYFCGDRILKKKNQR